MACMAQQFLWTSSLLPEASAFSLDIMGSKKKSSEGSAKSTTTTGTSQTDAKKNQDEDKSSGFSSPFGASKKDEKDSD